MGAYHKATCDMGMTWCQQNEPRRKCGIQEGDRDTYGPKSTAIVLVNQTERGERILQIRNPGIGHKTIGEQTLGSALLLGLPASWFLVSQGPLWPGTHRTLETFNVIPQSVRVHPVALSCYDNGQTVGSLETLP